MKFFLLALFAIAVSAQSIWFEHESSSWPPARRDGLVFQYSSDSAMFYMLGGLDESTPTYFNDLYTFDSESMLFSLVPTTGDGPAPFRSGCVGVQNTENAFVFGGDNSIRSQGDFVPGDDHLSNTLHRLQSGSEWTAAVQTGDVPTPRMGHSCAVYGDTLFLYSGQTSDSAWDFTLYTADLSAWPSVTWTRASTSPLPAGFIGRVWALSLVRDNMWYLHSGWQGGEVENIETNQIFSLDMATYSTGGKFSQVKVKGKSEVYSPGPISSHLGYLVDDRYWVQFGGITTSDEGENTLYAFDMKNQKWINPAKLITGTPLPHKRYSTQVFGYDTTFIIYGGATGYYHGADDGSADWDTTNWSFDDAWSVDLPLSGAQLGVQFGVVVFALFCMLMA